MPHILRLLTLTLLLATVAAGHAQPDPLQAQRQLFLQARAALHDNQLSRYRQLGKKLRDYPLYSYLEFEALRNRLSSAGEGEITRFLDTYRDQPVSERLQRAWLYSLARHRRWELFLKHYQPSSSVDLQCYQLQARLHTGRMHGLVEDGRKLWLAGKSQPKACDPVFKYLYDNGHIDNELVWQRIRLAMANSRTSLAGYLARRLPAEDQARVTLWREAHENPSSTLADPRLDSDTPLTREIIVHAIQRLARFDAGQAHKKWQTLRKNYDFSAARRGEAERYIALRSATQRLPEAHERLVQVPQDHQDLTIREWQIRTALTDRNWAVIPGHVATLPADEREQDEWRYWQALALEKTGRRETAMREFEYLARQRSYYGFLAADTLRWPYEMGHTPLAYNQDELERLARTPAMLRAHELYRAGLLTDARREWAHATRGMSNTELKLAAVLASQWGWNDRAILTVARSGDYADLKLRFPLDYADRVRLHAKRNDLDPAHVFAVIRQESAFNKDARSHAGAMGLMQLMPQTGKLTAKQHRIPLTGTRSLFDADKNIQIGTTYLRQVMDRYGNNPVLASASYNAGPHRVQRWLPVADNQDTSVWIANIPFQETRKYVQRVLAYAAIYDWRMERPVTRLGERMPTVMPEPAYTREPS